MNEQIRKSRPAFNDQRQNVECTTLERARRLSLQFRIMLRWMSLHQLLVQQTTQDTQNQPKLGLKVEKQVKRAQHDWNPIRAEVSPWQQKRCLSTLLKLIPRRCRSLPSKEDCLPLNGTQWQPPPGMMLNTTNSDTKPILSCMTCVGSFSIESELLRFSSS